APDVFGFAEDGRRALAPRRGVQNVAVGVCEQAEAIIFRPARARRIHDENFSVVLENLRAFADGHPDSFPILIRLAEQHARAADRVGMAHWRDVEILSTVAFPAPTRPDKKHPPVFEHEWSSINGPALRVEATTAEIRA